MTRGTRWIVIVMVGVLAVGMLGTAIWAWAEQERTRDSDGDGISDQIEQAGMRSCDGQLIYTDPNNPDWDSDGLTDGEEMGRLQRESSTECYRPLSHPRRTDTDYDGIDDPDEAEFGASPWKEDSDDDGLGDVEELVRYTDLLSADTDGDGLSDKEEIARNRDPLLQNRDLTVSDIGGELFAGVGAGLLHDKAALKEHASTVFFLGYTLGSLVRGTCLSAPKWITEPISLLSAFGEIVGCLFKGDIVCVGVEFFNLIVGEFSSKLGCALAAVEFVTEHGDQMVTIAIIFSQAPDPFRTDSIRATIPELIERLKRKGLSEKYIFYMLENGVNVQMVEAALVETKLLDEHPGIAGFLQTSDEKELVKGLAAAQEVGDRDKSYVAASNLKRKYVKTKVLDDVIRSGGGVALTQVYTGNRPTDIGGYDAIVRMPSGKIRIIEVIFVDSITSTVTLNGLRNYARLDTDKNLEFNTGYFKKETRRAWLTDQARQEITNAYEAGNLEVEIVISGPRSSEIKEQLGIDKKLAWYTIGVDKRKNVNLSVSALNK